MKTVNVPVEPTEEMIKAAQSVELTDWVHAVGDETDILHINECSAYDIYQAMLAVAPQAEPVFKRGVNAPTDGSIIGTPTISEQSINVFARSKSEVLRLDKDGMTYRGERILDAGQAYTAFTNWLAQVAAPHEQNAAATQGNTTIPEYVVHRRIDPTGRHKECEYFVLNLVHDKFSADALDAYSTACNAEFPKLAYDLHLKAGMIRMLHGYPAPAAAPEASKLPLSTVDIERYRENGSLWGNFRDNICRQALAALELEQRVKELEAEIARLKDDYGRANARTQEQRESRLACEEKLRFCETRIDSHYKERAEKAEAALASARAQEWERCAKVCLEPKDYLRIEWAHDGNRACAKAIRALIDKEQT